MNNLYFDYDDDYYVASTGYAQIKSKINSKFLYHYLHYSKFVDSVLKRCTGTSYPAINANDLKSIKIKIPLDFKEQMLIGNIFDKFDQKIKLLEKKHQSYIDFKKYLMQQIFTQKLRFNEYCEEIELGNIVNYQNSKALEKYFNDSNGYEVISIGNYTTDGNYIKNNVFISKDVDEVQKYVLNRNDLAMVLNDKTQKGNIIGRCILIDENDKYVYNQRTTRLTPKIEVNPYYLHQLINSPTIHKKIFALSQGATQIYINKDDLLNIKLPIPNTEVQNEFGNLFSNVNKKIELSSLRVNQMILFKKSMLQQMFV